MAPQGETQSKPAASRRRRIGFRVAAVIIGLLPFIVLEVSLRAFDVQRPTGYIDPFVGFSNLHPQFEKNEDEGIYETTLSRQLFFGRQEFAIEKPKNGYRVFCLGGSTVRGRPYTTETAFARWMQLELSQTDPEHTYEVVNCGGLSYASYRLAALLKEVLTYKPDAIVLATGHNEFLEDRTFKEIKGQSQSRRWISEKLHSLRTVTAARRIFDEWRGKQEKPRKQDNRQQLEEELETRLDDKASGYASYHRDAESIAWRKKVVEHYNIALRGMVAMCREADVPIILVHLGSNLRDCPPVKWEARPDYEGDDVKSDKEWRGAFRLATETERSEIFPAPERYEQALKYYRAAEKIDGEHALLCYRMARVLDRLGDFKEARKYYIKAKDYDVCPLRMLESMSQVIKQVAEETGTPLVDARAMIESRSPQGLPGSDYYLDHVHPTIGGHQLIARGLVERMRKEQIAPAGETWSESARRRAYAKHIAGLDHNYYGKAVERVSWLEGWAHRDKTRAEMEPVDERGYLWKAHRLMNLGLNRLALHEYVITIQRDPEMFPTVLERVLDLYRQGRTASAEQLLEPVTDAVKDAEFAAARFAAAVITLHKGDKATAAKITAEIKDHYGKIPADSPWRKAYPNAYTELRPQ